MRHVKLFIVCRQKGKDIMHMIKAKIFGSSLYNLAEQEGAEKEILCDLRNIAVLLKKHPDYIKILDSPRIERGDLMTILNEDFFGRINKYTLNFLKLLCEKHIVHKFEECLNEYERIYNENHNVKIVNVTTAKPLSEALADKLIKKLSEKTDGEIILEKHIDESCIGGIIIESDGKRIDSSIKTELSELKKEIIS